MAATLSKSEPLPSANPRPDAMTDDEVLEALDELILGPSVQKKKTRRGIKKIRLSDELSSLVDVCLAEMEFSVDCSYGPFLGPQGVVIPDVVEVAPPVLGFELVNDNVPKNKKTRRGKKKSSVPAPSQSTPVVASVPEPPIVFGTFVEVEAPSASPPSPRTYSEAVSSTPVVAPVSESKGAAAPGLRPRQTRAFKKHSGRSASSLKANAPFRYGFYHFDKWFKPAMFDAGWFIRQDGIDWFMYEFAGKRWCISRKDRNRQMHASNGNGSCFSVSVNIDNAPRYTSSGVQVTPGPFPCFKSTSEVEYEQDVFYSQVEEQRPPRSSDRKLANRRAHSDNGNSSSQGSDFTSEPTRMKNDEISRDIEETVQSFERSNLIDVQAIKSPDEVVPAEQTYLNKSTDTLAYRRHQLAKLTLTSETAVHTPILDIDPFHEYANSTFNHNSSMSAFRDIYFDLDIDVIVQALPAMGGILHFVFDRFGGTGTTREHLFSYPINMVDLSSKDSISFPIKMELPYRVMNMVRTSFSSKGNGRLIAYLATPFVTPAGMAMPATVTLFARASNVQPFNLKKRVSIIMESSLVALDSTTEQNMNYVKPAINVMRPNEIAGQWGFLSMDTIPLEAGPDHLITMIEAHPAAGDTPLSQVAQAYSYWRGGLKYKFTCNLSKFQNLTVAAVFVPKDAPYEGLYDAYAWQEIMFDEKHEAVMKVNFAHGNNWLPVYQDNYSQERTTLGNIHIIVRSSEVTTTPYNDPPSFLVQVCAADDFDVAHPRDYGKRWQQPAVLEGDVLNPEVPRSFAQSSKNLYQDARLPNFVDKFELNEHPMMIPVTCTDSRVGVLGLLQNTHAAWSGSIDYYFVFEGHGQCEIRYDPTKRVENSTMLRQADHQACAGYTVFASSLTNPHTHVRVPFSSVYDYMPTRDNGFQRDLACSNCNGCLFVSGRGVVRMYRAAGVDFKVHFYNGVHSFLTAPETTRVARLTGQTLDPVDYPMIPTAPWRGLGNVIAPERPMPPLRDPMNPVPERPVPPPAPVPPMQERQLDLEAGLFPNLDEVNVAARKAALLVDEFKAEVPEILVNTRQCVSDVNSLVNDVSSLVPDMRKLLEKTTEASETATSVTNSICSLLSGPTAFATALGEIAKSGINVLEKVVLSIHGAVMKVLKVVTPDIVLRFLQGITELDEEALALIYCVAIVSGAMALGIDNGWAVAGVIACIGCAIPAIGPIVGKLCKVLFERFSASAVKETRPEMEAAPSPLACGGAILATVVGFFVPSKSGLDLDASAVLGSKITRIYQGAKSLDEMIPKFLELLLSLPFVEKLLGDNYKDVKVLAEVDVEAFVSEIKDLMSTDFYNLPLTNEKVRQQEKLWAVNKKLDKLLPQVNGTNYFFNMALRKVMDEQQKMYRHSKTFKAAGRERIPPFIAMFAGKTRVGKSTMVMHMNKVICNMMGWDAEEDIYTRTPSDAYYSGLAHQKILYVDDLHTAITSDGADSDMTMVMSFGSNAPWAPPQAAVDDKGRPVSCLIGNFCTNTPGVPTFCQIRNPSAYLARRHILVLMRRKKDSPEGEYKEDFSHAEFVLLNPHDQYGTEELDECFRPVRPGMGKVYEFPEFWKLYCQRFLQHVVRERKARHARQNNAIDLEMPEGELLNVAKDICSHFEDVDHVPIERVNALVMEGEATASPLTERQMRQMVGTDQRYRQVLASYHIDRQRWAIGDIYYIPIADTFIWKRKNYNNGPLFKELVKMSEETAAEVEPQSEQDYDKVNETIQNLVNALWQVTDQERYMEMLECVDDDIVEAVKRGVERRREVWNAGQKCGMIGRRHFAKILLDMYCAIPDWWPKLVAAISLGGYVYSVVSNVRRILKVSHESDEKLKETAAPRPVACATVEPQYAKEILPAMGMPPRKPVSTSVVPQYAKEVSPAVGMPPRKPVSATIAPQYAKEVAPAVAMPPRKPAELVVEPQYAKEITPSLAMAPRKTAVTHVVAEYDDIELATNVEVNVHDPLEEEENGKITISTTMAPRSTSVKSVVVMESANCVDQATSMYRHNRIGKIHRKATMLNFMFLDDKTVLCPRHFWTVGGGVSQGEKITLYWKDKNGALEYSWNLDLVNIKSVPESDASMVVLPDQLAGIRSSWNLIPTEAELTGTYPSFGVLIGHTDELDFYPQRLTSVSRREVGKTMSFYMNLDGSRVGKNSTTIYLDGYSYPAVTGGGTCGSIMMLPLSGGKVYGMHSAAFREGDDAGVGVATMFWREQLQAALQGNEPIFPARGEDYTLPEPVYEERERALDVILTLESGTPDIDVSPYGLRVVGVVSHRTAGNMWTKYKSSPLSRFFPEAPFRVPAITHTGDKRAPYEYDPRPDILGKYNKPISAPPEDLLQRVVEHMAGEYRTLQHPFRPSKLLSLEEAINGVPEAPFYDAINMHTSPGVPYSNVMGYTKKGSLFREVGTYANGLPRRVVEVSMVEERFNQIVAAAREGNQLPGVVFQEFMKDELLKRAKVYEKPATRGIANPPIDLLLAERAAFLPFIALLQYNRHKVDCQVGINPMSGIEWTELRHRLEANSDLVFDADYTAFDSTIHPRIIRAFAQIVNGTMGGSFETQMARLVLASYSCDRVSQVTNVQVKIDQGMASGMPFTAVGNSIVNSIYLRLAWLMLALKHSPEHADLRIFDRMVKAAVYGDDNMVSVKAEVADWYNLRNIALELEQFGILMTDGQKNARHLTQPFSSWDKIRFLKRAFVLDPNTRLYLAPLDRKTILDRMRYTRAKAWKPDMMMRIEMSLMDAVYHGPEYFAALKFFVNSCLAELHLPQINMSFREERLKWESSSLMLDMQGPGEITFAKEERDGNVQIYYAQVTDPPTQIGPNVILRLRGPRVPVGDESRPLGMWKVDYGRTPPSLPPITPPTATGMTVEEMRRVFEGKVGLMDTSSFDSKMSAQTFEIVRQLEDRLNSRPNAGSLTLNQLREEINRIPVGMTLQQFREETSRTGNSTGVTLVQLQQELNMRLPCLRVADIRRENESQTQTLLSVLRPTPPTVVVPPVPIPPVVPPQGQDRRVFEAGRRGIIDSWNVATSMEQHFYVRYDGPPRGVIVVDGERFMCEYFELYWSDGMMTLIVDDEELTDARVVSVSSAIAPRVYTSRREWSNWGPWRGGRKFDVLIGLGSGSEIGNFQDRTGNLEQQLQERLAKHPGKYIVHEFAGRKFYQHLTHPTDMVWPWILVHWNCVQILELLGARNVPKFACSHGRWEWDHMTEYTVNIAAALFGNRRLRPGRRP